MGEKHGEVVLAVGQPAVGGLLEPVRRGGIVCVVPAIADDEHGQIVHGPDMALLGCPPIPDLGPLGIDADADAALVVGRKPELGRSQPVHRRPLVPGKCQLVVPRHAIALGNAGSHLELGEGVAVGGRVPQRRRTDAWRRHGVDAGRCGAVIGRQRDVLQDRAGQRLRRYGCQLPERLRLAQIVGQGLARGPLGRLRHRNLERFLFVFRARRHNLGLSGLRPGLRIGGALFRLELGRVGGRLALHCRRHRVLLPRGHGARGDEEIDGEIADAEE